MLNYIGRDRQC